MKAAKFQINLAKLEQFSKTTFELPTQIIEAQVYPSVELVGRLSEQEWMSLRRMYYGHGNITTPIIVDGVLTVFGRWTDQFDQMIETFITNVEFDDPMQGLEWLETIEQRQWEKE